MADKRVKNNVSSITKTATSIADNPAPATVASSTTSRVSITLRELGPFY